MIDFGDGSPHSIIDEEIKHVYKEPGSYVVEFSSLGPRDEPMITNLEVVVE